MGSTRSVISVRAIAGDELEVEIATHQLEAGAVQLPFVLASNVKEYMLQAYAPDLPQGTVIGVQATAADGVISRKKPLHNLVTFAMGTNANANLRMPLQIPVAIRVPQASTTDSSARTFKVRVRAVRL